MGLLTSNHKNIDIIQIKHQYAKGHKHQKWKVKQEIWYSYLPMQFAIELVKKMTGNQTTKRTSRNHQKVPLNMLKWWNKSPNPKKLIQTKSSWMAFGFAENIWTIAIFENCHDMIRKKKKSIHTIYKYDDTMCWEREIPDRFLAST